MKKVLLVTLMGFVLNRVAKSDLVYSCQDKTGKYDESSLMTQVEYQSCGASCKCESVDVFEAIWIFTKDSSPISSTANVEVEKASLETTKKCGQSCLCNTVGAEKWIMQAEEILGKPSPWV